MTPEQAFTAITPAIAAAAAALWYQRPDVASREALVSDLSLRILDRGLSEDLAAIEQVGERVWWIQGMGYQLLREYIAEFEQHKGEVSGE